MPEVSPPWSKQGPASYFPSIEKTYGRSIAEWQQIIGTSPVSKHMEIVNWLKAEYGMGHGHANALVGWTLVEMLILALVRVFDRDRVTEV